MRIKVRFKSGFELPITCDDFGITTHAMTGEITEYDIKGIKDNKPAIEQPHWIPCSEKLPESYTDVLVWFEYFRYGEYNCLYQTHGLGSYSAEYESWMINHETGWHKLRVIAWMPLPEPWRGEEE